MNDSSISLQVPTLDAKLAARGYRIDLHHRFARASLSRPEGGESCIMLENGLNRSLVAKLTQRSSLAVGEFHAASEEHYK